MSDFWDRVKQEIISQNTSQEWVANKAKINFGTMKQQIHHNRWPDAEEAQRIAATLGVTVEYLVTGAPPEGIPPEIIAIARTLARLDRPDLEEIMALAQIKLARQPKKEGSAMQTLEVREAEPAYLPQIAAIPVREEVRNNVIFHEWAVIEIPLVGSTAAGQPIDFGDLDPNPATRPWAASLIRGDPGDYYCVLVRGTSMIEADIKDGDFALIKHTQGAEHGEIMLVRYGDESTLKRVRVVDTPGGAGEVYICWEDGSGHSVRLDREEYEIQGRLIAIERKPRKPKNNL